MQYANLNFFSSTTCIVLYAVVFSKTWERYGILLCVVVATVAWRRQAERRKTFGFLPVGGRRNSSTIILFCLKPVIIVYLRRKKARGVYSRRLT